MSETVDAKRDRLGTWALVLSSSVIAVPLLIGRLVEAILKSLNPAGVAYLREILGFGGPRLSARDSGLRLRGSRGVAHRDHPQAGPRRGLSRIADFPAIGWAFAYDEGVTLEPGETFELGNRLIVLDGTRPVEEVVAFLAAG